MGTSIIQISKLIAIIQHKIWISGRRHEEVNYDYERVTDCKYEE